jgi:hypothetical protein
LLARSYNSSQWLSYRFWPAKPYMLIAALLNNKMCHHVPFLSPKSKYIRNDSAGSNWNRLRVLRRKIIKLNPIIPDLLEKDLEYFDIQ